MTCVQSQCKSWGSVVCNHNAKADEGSGRRDWGKRLVCNHNAKSWWRKWEERLGEMTCAISMNVNITPSLGALLEHTAQGHHHRSLGVDSPLELKGWVVLRSHQIFHCLLKRSLQSWVVMSGHLSDLNLYCQWKGWVLMSASSLLCSQGLWLLVCLWFVPHKVLQLLEVYKG